MKEQLVEPVRSSSMFRAWLVLVAASFLFFYTFIQMNMLNPIDAVLMKQFQLSAASLGTMSAMYFYGNFLLLFPAGLILDRISPRKVAFFAILIASITMITFAHANTYLGLCVSRFIQGSCGSFGFLSAIRIVSRWFPPKKLALASGVIVTFAMLGGMVAQEPVAELTQLMGWREALLVFAGLGFVLMILEWLIVRDYAAGYQTEDDAHHTIEALGLWRSIRMVVLNRYNWFGGFYTTLMNLPIFVLGALWGDLYLTQAQQLSTLHASEVTSQLFFGTLIGAPLVGWISDKMKRRIMPMFFGAILSLAIIVVIIYTFHLSFSALLIMFFLLGLITSTQVLSYPTIAELNSPLVTSSAISVISLLLMASGFVAQPIFGWLLDLKWSHEVVNNVAIYSVADFRTAMWMLPLGFILSIFVSLMIKETRCQFAYEEQEKLEME